MLKCVIFAIFLSVAHAQFWQGCPNSVGVAPDQVTSPSCSGNQCHGVRGQVLTANVAFTPRTNHNDLRVEVWATILGIQIQLPGEHPHDNACNNIFIDNQRTQCPIAGSRQHTWIIEMEIPLTLPSLSTTIRYEIFDGTNVVLCATINAVLV